MRILFLRRARLFKGGDKPCAADIGWRSLRNTAAEEKVLSENNKIDPAKLQALIFDQFQHGYYVSGEQVGKAWNAGAGLMKK